MTPTQVTGLGYAVAMVLAGLAVGAVVRGEPSLADGALPPALAILLASLLVDLGIARFAAAGRIAPLVMAWRIGGFIAGIVVYALVAGRI